MLFLLTLYIHVHQIRNYALYKITLLLEVKKTEHEIIAQRLQCLNSPTTRLDLTQVFGQETGLDE